MQTGKVKYVVHPYYLLGNPETELAAEAAWCAHDQGKYFEYERVLYERQGALSYTQDGLTDVAQELGLDVEAFAQCMSNRTHRADLENAANAAASKGINSTPTFLINNQRLKGNYPYEEFQRIIDAELAKSQ